MKRLIIGITGIWVMLSAIGAFAQYKTRSAFSSNNAYGDYVKAQLQKGMRVVANQDYYEIGKGDKGTYFGSNNGNPPCLVQWDDYIGKSPTLMAGFPEDKKSYAYWIDWHMLDIAGSSSPGGELARVSINKTFRAQDEQTYTFSISYSADLSNAKLILNGRDYDYDHDGDYTDFTITLNGTKLIYQETLHENGMSGTSYSAISFDVSGIAKKGSNTLTIKETEVSGQTDKAYLRYAVISGGVPVQTATRSSGDGIKIAVNKRFEAQDEGQYSFYVPGGNPKTARMELYGADYDYDNDGDYTDFTIEVNGTIIHESTPLHDKGLPGKGGYGNATFDISSAIRAGSNNLRIKETETDGQTDYGYIVHAMIYTGGATSATPASASYSGDYEELIYLRDINKKYTAQTQEKYNFYNNSGTGGKAYLLLGGSDYDHDNDGDYTDFTLTLNGNDIINIEQLQREGIGADGNQGFAAWDISSDLRSGLNELTIKQTEDKSQVDYAELKTLAVMASGTGNIRQGTVNKTVQAPNVKQAPANLSIESVKLTSKYTIVDVSYSGTQKSCINPAMYIKEADGYKQYAIQKVSGVPFCRKNTFQSTDRFQLYFKPVASPAGKLDIIEPATSGSAYSFYGVDVSSSGSGQVAKRKKEPSGEGAFKSSMPPILSIQDITFSENVLNAEETAQLTVSLKNVGPGAAKDVYLSINGYLQGLDYPKKTVFSTIPANGGTQSLTVDIKGGLDLPTAEATLTLKVVEPHFKVEIEGKKLKFPTKAFRNPELILAKHAIMENQSANPNNQIDINEMIDLKFIVQNVGSGDAENVSVSIENNQPGVMLLGVVQNGELKRQDPKIETLPSGKYQTFVFRYFVNSEFKANELAFNIQASERIGKYGFTKTRRFPINTELEEEGFIRNVASTEETGKDREVVIEDIPELTVDVDTDIPTSDANQPHTYALIIGNEDYQSRQKGLTEEQNVDYAVNDARVFAQYCERTLGIPKKQIKFLENATAAEMHQGLSWISNLAKIEDGNAKLIFYYSGHGLPHEQTKAPYIIPVDVSGKNIEYAVKLDEVYKKLTEHPTQQTTVFLDACFSGGGREQGLLAVKGMRIKPKTTQINKRVVSFSSSTGDESSSVYREKHHGYFTYFLLKKLKTTHGTAAYGELSNYIIKNVQKETGLMSKIQTPQVKVSPKVKNQWKDWTLK